MSKVQSTEVTPVVETPLVEVASAGVAPSFRVVKAVTRPLIRFGVSPEFVRFEGPVYQSARLEHGTPAQKKMEPPFMADVENLKTGEAGQIILPTVLHKELDEKYPEHSYVSKNFQLRKINIDGKSYSIWSITEIELT